MEGLQRGDGGTNPKFQNPNPKSQCGDHSFYGAEPDWFGAVAVDRWPDVHQEGSRDWTRDLRGRAVERGRRRARGRESLGSAARLGRDDRGQAWRHPSEYRAADAG